MDDRIRTRLKGLMGLSVRAGQATFGQDGCLSQMRKETCSVLLLDETASANTRGMYENAAHTHGIPLFLLPEGLLFEATGRPGVAMTVSKGGLGTQILQLRSEQGSETIQQIISGGAYVE